MKQSAADLKTAQLGQIDDASCQLESCENGNAKSQHTVASDSKLKQDSIKIFGADQTKVSNARLNGVKQNDDMFDGSTL